MAWSRLLFPLAAIALAVLVLFLVTFYRLEFRHRPALIHEHHVQPPDKVPKLRSSQLDQTFAPIGTSQPTMAPTAVVKPSRPPLTRVEVDRSVREERKAPFKRRPMFIDEVVRPKKTSSQKPNLQSSPGPSPRQKPVKKRGSRNKYWTPEVYDFQADWGSHGELPFIEVMPTPRKILIKQNRKVVFPNISIPLPGRDNNSYGSAMNEVEADAIPARVALQALQGHLLFKEPAYRSSTRHNLTEVMLALKTDSRCMDTPIFLTMATVGDELYWQLIENFVYTMTKFHLESCSLVICVSDPRCVRLCDQASFPCYDFSDRAYPSVMEQIAMLKLKLIPQALLLGVDVFMLDLDVGFLADPANILQAYRATPVVDILVQVC